MSYAIYLIKNTQIHYDTMLLSTLNYFLRLAREVGYFNFVYRYSLRRLYKLLKIDQKIRLMNNIEMILPWSSQFGTEVFLKKNKVDWGSEAILLNFLEQDKSFLDVGANIGYYSLLAAPSSKEVYIFEPDPRVVENLKKNLTQFSNTFIIQEALYSQSGVMKLNLSITPEVNSLVRTNSHDNSIEVKVNTLDNLMSEYPNLTVSCIKTDAEGADFEILRGGKNLILRDQPLILSEAYPEKQLLKFIESVNFSCFAFVKSKDISRSHLPPQFVKIESQPVNHKVKMIFLVPNRLLADFESLVKSEG
ncbi:FkbM family methyltransferase [Spirulina sp. CS-785/01]|uniref:FkbM family methyltransferase n=1 Tax=Spirulina sp. CS-785/01 TaxID=3021716 RepID=UPI00232E18AD|nr:FkbM family methyltransferase [Spirulina sp. CS-785/01]MDB9315897.1 FkbM family methyltransferase [Spirulina sp. CS-785/01]